MFFLTTLRMRQELSIPILQRSKLKLWAIKQLAQGPVASKSQRPDSNPDVFHKLSTTGPQPPAGEGTREPQKVLNRKQKSREPFWDNFLVASQEAQSPSVCSQGLNGRAPCLSLPEERTPAQNPQLRKAKNEHSARPPPTRPKGWGTSSNLQL